MPGPANDDMDVQVDPNAVIARLQKELGGWITRALVAEEATATLQAEKRKAAQLEAKRQELAEAPKAV